MLMFHTYLSIQPTIPSDRDLAVSNMESFMYLSLQSWITAALKFYGLPQVLLLDSSHLQESMTTLNPFFIVFISFQWIIA